MTTFCPRCGSPLWSGHVCPAAPISERVPQITYGDGLVGDLYRIWFTKRAVEKAQREYRR